jgi:hypothetical protein
MDVNHPFVDHFMPLDSARLVMHLLREGRFSSPEHGAIKPCFWNTNTQHTSAYV